MRRNRFLLPFSLGALSMLALVIAAAWAAPGLLVRVGTALGPGASSPRVAVAPAPAGAAPGAPAGAAPAPADPADEAQWGAAPADVPEPAPAANPADGSKLLIPVQGVEAASLVDTYEQARDRAGATTPSTSWPRAARRSWRSRRAW